MAIDIDSLDAYRKGANSGVMKNATPNVVKQLIGWIDELRAACCEASNTLNAILDDDDASVTGYARGDIDNVRLDLFKAAGTKKVGA
jgi:hypothetical protein